MQNKLEMLRIFCVAAESRNFKEAATRLAISPQAVTRAIKALETQVGELLFHRNTRTSRITEFGERLAVQAKLGLGYVDDIFRDREAETDAELAGLVRITAPKSLGQAYILPVLGELCAQHPGLRLDLRLSDQVADAVNEQIDIGIRVGFMRDSRYVARAVAPVPFHIVGTPELAARVGQPDSPEQLADYPVTVMIDPHTGKPWPWFLADGQQWHPQEPVFVTDDTRTECDAVLAGVGFGQLAGYFAIPHLRSGRLVEVLPDWAPPPWNLYVYRPQRGPVAARIRLVYDRLAAFFSDPARFPRTPKPP